MSTTLAAESAKFARAQALLPGLRAGERAVVFYFLFLTGLAWSRHLDLLPRLSLPMLGLSVWRLAAFETARSRPWSRVLRDWLSMGLILAAYWSAGWFVAPPIAGWQETWIVWDRVLLDDWGVRGWIESAGMLIPSLLESAYLILYALPPIGVGLLYWLGGRRRVEPFLHMLLLGTICAYALLPVFPVHGPRVAYAGLDLPGVAGFGRPVNEWVLNHMDMPTSVFPSGHVAVGFATAFGMVAAVPERRALLLAFFTVATLVYFATIYCRYHYAVDGLASILLVSAVYTAFRRGGLVA